MIVYFKYKNVFYCETRILWHIMVNISALAEGYLGISAPFWRCLFLGKSYICSTNPPAPQPTTEPPRQPSNHPATQPATHPTTHPAPMLFSFLIDDCRRKDVLIQPISAARNTMVQKSCFIQSWLKCPQPRHRLGEILRSRFA